MVTMAIAGLGTITIALGLYIIIGGVFEKVIDKLV